MVAQPRLPASVDDVAVEQAAGVRDPPTMGPSPCGQRTEQLSTRADAVLERKLLEQSVGAPLVIAIIKRVLARPF